MASQVHIINAKDLFNKVTAQAAMRKVMGFLTRQEHNLRSYEAEHLDVAAQHYAGVQSIAIDEIKGSLNRVEDFDENFLPKTENTKERWMSICVAMLEEKALPAIKVYRIDNTYFVEDGHHRVSVAKALGYLYIDAIVIEIETQLAA